MNVNDTIVAISTAPGVGAIAIVRLSGPQSFPLAARMFSHAGATSPQGHQHTLAIGQDDSEANLEKPIEAEIGGSSMDQSAVFHSWQSHLARFGYIRDPESKQIVDEVVLIPYKGPRTYTGEDLIEINCHGGWLVPSEIVALCLKLGARLAKPGEFTERAFLSGRIDLTQAEAVIDLIQAKTSRQGRAAISALSGQLGQQIVKVRSKLVDLLAEIVAGIDFPDEVGEASGDKIKEVVEHCLPFLEDLHRTARSGRFMREGVRLAIVGRPNAGKSSLLNQFLKFERAIVTDTPGTTRDSLEELLDLNGVPVILIDTAGIRSTEDHVEKIGIERTISAIEQSDLSLFMIDLVEGWSEPETEICQLIESRPYILIGNKVDRLDHDDPEKHFPHDTQAVAKIAISATQGNGMPELTATIEKWVFAGQRGQELRPSLNARQAELCLRSANALRLVRETLASGLPQDCLATDLKTSVDALSEICGEAVSEEVIHQVFANFCVGK